MKTFFFFFFFGDHLILGGKIVRISDYAWKRLKTLKWLRLKTLNFGEDLFFFFWRLPDFGRKNRSNFRFQPKIHSQFRLRQPNFWGFGPPNQKSWLRLWLYPFTKNFFRKIFVQYVTVWLVRIWTYKNADEKAHTFSRSKNVKKTDENVRKTDTV